MVHLVQDTEDEAYETYGASLASDWRVVLLNAPLSESKELPGFKSAKQAPSNTQDHPLRVAIRWKMHLQGGSINHPDPNWMVLV